MPPEPYRTFLLIPIFSLIITVSSPVIAQSTKAEVSALKPSDLRDFNSYPPQVKKYVAYALKLTGKNLRYQYGSNDPKNGGMDCSGTVQHVLSHCGHRSPRQCNHLYLWVRENGNLHEVKNPKSLSDGQLSHLQPGDLVFWEGTYNIGKRFPPTSHVMIFLGHRETDGKPVMVGASSGRTYQGKSRHGVSVFDFKLPRSTSSSKLVGYGPVPGVKHLGRELPPLSNPGPKKIGGEKKKPKSSPKIALATAKKTSALKEKSEGEPENLSVYMPISTPTKPIKSVRVPEIRPAAPPLSKMGDRPRKQTNPRFKNFFKNLGRKSRQ